MFPEEIQEEIEFEFEEIESLFELYKEELFCLKQKPNLFEITAYAGILHSFYNGLEKILLIISKNIDRQNLTDSKWHKSLLEGMAKENESRKAVLSEEMKNQLMDYLGFRHFFRHAYSFHLEWEEMEDLIKSIHDVWVKFKKEMTSFINNFP
ncbi:MAG: hypothetical protein NT166_22765 [Candidatus Aminicenantes bacterium]|nr:hypothetical protein [Candidatus Aminicenantes bacterium]